LLSAVEAFDAPPVDSADPKYGVDIVCRAMEALARQIAKNAGAEGSIIVGKLHEKSAVPRTGMQSPPVPGWISVDVRLPHQSAATH
jgi:chaperonin GroEL (HSP60 family)